MEVGIVMDDVRYTNFDVTKYWKTQTWRYTDFDDVPDGTADKLILVPERGAVEACGTAHPRRFRRAYLRRLAVDADESAGQ